jgi:hypothetical protein
MVACWQCWCWWRCSVSALQLLTEVRVDQYRERPAQAPPSDVDNLRRWSSSAPGHGGVGALFGIPLRIGAPVAAPNWTTCAHSPESRGKVLVPVDANLTCSAHTVSYKQPMPLIAYVQQVSEQLARATSLL